MKTHRSPYAFSPQWTPSMDFVVVVVNWHYCSYRYVLHTYSKYFCSIWRGKWRELKGPSVERGSFTHNCVTFWESPRVHLCEADAVMVKGGDSGASLLGFERWLDSFWSVWPEASDVDSLFSYLRKRGNNRRQLRKSKCVKTLAQCLPHGRCSKMFIILNICVEREEILVRGREIQNWRISLFTRVITTAWCWG